VVRKCKTVVEGRRLQTTYVHILKWLGVELAGAAMCGRLTDLQFAQRRDLLTELVADAGERQLVMRPDGTWFACRPELEGILWKYYASEARIALLNFLARAESRVSPSLPEDPTSLLQSGSETSWLWSCFCARGSRPAPSCEAPSENFREGGLGGVASHERAASLRSPE
jgi:hypothetical protein